jgi:hypothetical protein
VLARRLWDVFLGPGQCGSISLSFPEALHSLPRSGNVGRVVRTLFAVQLESSSIIHKLRCDIALKLFAFLRRKNERDADRCGILPTFQNHIRGVSAIQNSLMAHRPPSTSRGGSTYHRNQPKFGVHVGSKVGSDFGSTKCQGASYERIMNDDETKEHVIRACRTTLAKGMSLRVVARTPFCLEHLVQDGRVWLRSGDLLIRQTH